MDVTPSRLLPITEFKEDSDTDSVINNDVDNGFDNVNLNDLDVPVPSSMSIIPGGTGTASADVASSGPVPPIVSHVASSSSSSSSSSMHCLPSKSSSSSHLPSTSRLSAPSAAASSSPSSSSSSTPSPSLIEEIFDPNTHMWTIHTIQATRLLAVSETELLIRAMPNGIGRSYLQDHDCPGTPPYC
ncbi:hypothetical protein OF83DRAFT_1180209 [Amylostereum chailletii]|nr:hypothetical protein OF83DRAFT_1180209 [Amylostereum chailletii]